MKKIFYNKRHRLPVWSQIYVVWSVIFIVGMLWIGFFGIEKNAKSLNENFDYKKEDLEITKYYNYVKGAYPNASTYTDSIVSNLRNDLPTKVWNVELINHDQNGTKCTSVRYFPVNQKSKLIVVFNHQNQEGVLQMLHGFALTLSSNRLYDVSVISIQGDPLCSNTIIHSGQLNATVNAGLINLYWEKKKNSGLQTAVSGTFSPIAWSMIIPKTETRPNLFEQMSHMNIPFFQHLLDSGEQGKFRSINWFFPKDVYKDNTNTVHFILPGLLFTVKNYTNLDKNFQSNSLWLGYNEALSKTGALVLGILLILLSWLPVANRLYRKENVNNFFMSFFVAILNSLLIFLILGLTKFISFFSHDSLWGLVVLAIISVILIILFNRLQRTTFNMGSGGLTEFIIFNFFATILGVVNISLFIFLLPLIFIVSKKQDINRLLFRILVILSVGPFMYSAYILFNFYGATPALSLVWIQEVLYNNLDTTIPGILLLGSLLSNVRDQQST